jgi:hypothetical protein
MTDPERPPLHCPKCQREMEQGFEFERISGVRRELTTWMRGAPKRSLWHGIKTLERGIPIATFRCTVCGYLESYARDTYAAR